ncbi:phospholipase D-like domain-containing protein [Cytobacillus firmus]|uniref:phospholipase D-like domain-containing protein n=1 Tax=Cytobacillus firmus TaxID=1399 RepID=UPI003B9FE76D
MVNNITHEYNGTTFILHHDDFRLEEFFSDINLIATKRIFISTYIVDFTTPQEYSYIHDLKNIADKGIPVTLVCCSAIGQPDEDFKKLVACYELVTKTTRNGRKYGNHSKMILMEGYQGYIGSANFTYGSHSNIESGIMIYNTELIESLIDKFFYKGLLNSSHLRQLYNPPTLDIDYIYKINELASSLKKSVDRGYLLGTENEVLDKLKDLIKVNFNEINKKVLKYNANPFNVVFDISNIQTNLINNGRLEHDDFEDFDEYLMELLEWCEETENFIFIEYESKGALEYQDK